MHKFIEQTATVAGLFMLAAASSMMGVMLAVLLYAFLRLRGF